MRITDQRGAALRVLLAGGGSGGSVTPLLAVAAELRRVVSDVNLLLVGTATGPEQELARSDRIPYAAIQAGKLRRYWDVQNFTDFGRVGIGVLQALGLVHRFRPHVAIGAGGFGSVAPLVAARFCGVPVLAHQQDVEAGLANRLLAPFATRFTLSLEASLRYFPRDRSQVTGNPIRPAVLEGRAELAREQFGLESDIPIVVVTGGGTGALGLNALVADAVPQLQAFCQVIHLTGRGKALATPTPSNRYLAVEFVTAELPHLLAAADVVLCRAGMGTLTELAALGKPALVVPMPRSHQLSNARAFEALGAIEVAHQEQLTSSLLAERLRALLSDADRRIALSRRISSSMPRDAAARVARLVLQTATKGVAAH